MRSQAGRNPTPGPSAGERFWRAEKRDTEIYYTLEGPHDLKAGNEAIIKIDWTKRYRLMRLHFAAEIVLELVYQLFGRPIKLGANISEEKARIDFLWEGRISDVFPTLLERAGKIIQEDLPIRSEFSDREKEQRYWEIEGFCKSFLWRQSSQANRGGRADQAQAQQHRERKRAHRNHACPRRSIN